LAFVCLPLTLTSATTPRRSRMHTIRRNRAILLVILVQFFLYLEIGLL
jgi:hypothetical protein